VSDRYFKRRSKVSPSDFEGDYWGEIVDPDGIKRDRREERQQFLEDAAGEIAFLDSLTPGRILDVGCGLGFLLSALGEKWQRHGVEVSEYAAAHASKWGTIHHGQLLEAGFDAEFFDVVVMHHVIEHMPDPIEQLCEVSRVLRPGGRLLFATPDFESGCARRFGDRYRLLHDTTHIRLFSADSAHRLLRDMGFVIDHIDYPFFDTRHFSRENLLRLFDTDQVSPPFYGNFMTFYAHKPICAATVSCLQRLGVCGKEELAAAESCLESLVEDVAEHLAAGGLFVLDCETGGAAFQALALETLEGPLLGSGVRVVSDAAMCGEQHGAPLRISILAPSSPVGSDKRRIDVTIEPEGHQSPAEGTSRVVRYPTTPGEGWREPALMITGALALDLALALQNQNRIDSKGKRSKS